MQLLGTGEVELRGERQGTSNGRFYTVKLRATDPQGNSSEGACQFVVPHSLNPQANPVDDGAEVTCTGDDDCVSQSPQLPEHIGEDKRMIWTIQIRNREVSEKRRPGARDSDGLHKNAMPNEEPKLRDFRPAASN